MVIALNKLKLLNIIVDIMKEGNGQIASTLASKLESINNAIKETEDKIKAIQ